MKRHVWRISYFFIIRLSKIETSSTFLNSHQKILENFRKFRFSYFHLEKFQNLNFHFMKPYSPNSNIIITTYPCIYLYIQQCNFSLSPYFGPTLSLSTNRQTGSHQSFLELVSSWAPKLNLMCILNSCCESCD